MLPRKATIRAAISMRAFLAVIASLALAATTTILMVPAAQAATTRPAVTSVTPSTGVVTGKTRVVIRGARFTRVQYVTIGGVRATSLKVFNSRSLAVTTPAGFPGPRQVRVRTAYGTSPATTATRFVYTDPPASNEATLTPSAGTVTGSGVLWVTGGTDPERPKAGAVEPWVVALQSGTPIPTVGDDYLLPPGTSVYPSGLAGRVSAVASQADDITTLTVQPVPLSQVMDNVNIDYTDPPAGARMPAGRNSLDAAPTFTNIGPSAFACTNRAGRQVSFSGSLDLTFENMVRNFEMQTGNLFAQGYLSAWVRVEPVLTGKITASAQMTCNLRPEWQNSRRRIFFLGTTGATVSIAPTASVSISARGTFEISQRSRRMFGVQSFNGNFQNIDRRVDLGVSAGASRATFNAKASGGLSVQFGALDRVGIEGKAQAVASATMTARPSNVCVDVDLAAKLSVNAFLDVWVARWSSPAYAKSFPLAHWSRCVAPEASVPNSTAPMITSSRLPSGVNTRSYSQFVATADERPGSWAVTGGVLPNGLRLDLETGEISGVPNAQVGDYVVDITFRDLNGGTDTQPIRIYIYPRPPAGGGAVQTTLTWSSPMDLDLHVIEPNGDETYYGSRESSTGGTLDQDANAACGEAQPSPIENIFWPSAGAPAGSYTVAAVVYNDCGAADLSWHLVVRVGGVIVIDQRGSGDSPGYTFTVGGAGARVGRVPAPSFRHDLK